MADNSFGKLFGLDTEAEIAPVDLSQPTPDPLGNLHDVGQEETRAQKEREATLAEESGILSAAFEQNTGTMLHDTLQRKWDHTADPNFDPQEYIEKYKDAIPRADLSVFQDVRSEDEAHELLEDMVRQEENMELLAAHGASGFAAQMLTGMVDPIELPITAVSGGAFAIGKSASFGVKSILKSTAAGATTGAASTALNVSLDPFGDTKDIVSGALIGAPLGLGGGVLRSRHAQKANDAMDKARREHSAALDDVANPEDYTEAPVFNTDVGMDDPAMSGFEGPSIGAGSSNKQIDYDLLNDEQTSMVVDATRRMQKDGLAERLETPEFADTALGRTARRMSDALHDGEYMPDAMKTDWDRLASSDSAIEQVFAFDLFESAEGRAVNNRSGAMLQENYHQRIASQAMEQIEPTYVHWAKSRKLSLWDQQKDSNRVTFNRELVSEMEGRWQGEGSTTQDPAIKQLADALDNQNEIARQIKIGREGETSVFGSEDLQKKSGYVPHKWSGKAIRKLMRDKGMSRTRIEEFVEKQFSKMYPNVSPEDAVVISRAVIRRALNKSDGIDANMLATLDADGVHILTDVLEDAGVPKKSIDEMVERLRGKQDERGVQGSSKHRINFDMRASDGELSMMDLIDTDITRLYTQYNRQTAGSAALARKGITGTADRKKLIDSVIGELNARNVDFDGKKRREFLENMFTYFDAGPIAGGIDPMVGRLKRLTNLALLNQMGLTQLMETGAQVSAVGVQTWGKHAKLVMDEIKNGGADSPMAKELKPLMGSLGKEHLLERPDLMLDELVDSADGKSEVNRWLDTFDQALGKGQRVQGLISGFYAVKGLQQRIAVTSMADKIMQRVRDGVDAAELRDIGIDPAMVQKYIKNGAIEFEADGTTAKMNLESWDIDDAEDLVLALHRHTNKVVQKAMAGEESIWMHKTVGSLYMHLKTFPLLAMRKQFIRNAGVSNSTFVGTLMMGFATAAMFSSVKQVINGRSENLTPTKIVSSALGMGNMTGWFPMLADPAAAILGYDISAYGRHGIDQGVISTPPMIPTLNKMAHIVGAINPTSDLSHNERIRAMQATPLVGNLYGFSAMFNAMKE